MDMYDEVLRTLEWCLHRARENKEYVDGKIARAEQLRNAVYEAKRLLRDEPNAVIAATKAWNVLNSVASE